MNTKNMHQRAMELIDDMTSNDRHLGNADLYVIRDTLEDDEALANLGYGAEDSELVELVGEATSIVAGWIEEGRYTLSHVRTGVQWIMEGLDADDLDETLRGELEEPEEFEVCAAAELKGGFRTGQLTHVAYCDKTGRAGLIHVGSGSCGVSVWTDADSAEDALRRYMTDDISN